MAINPTKPGGFFSGRKLGVRKKNAEGVTISQKLKMLEKNGGGSNILNKKFGWGGVMALPKREADMGRVAVFYSQIY